MSASPIPETANRQDWPRLVAKGWRDHESRLVAIEGGGSGTFLLDDGTASTDGVFLFDEGAA